MQKLNMDDWREIFQDQIQKEKPNHSWSLKMDQQLHFNRLKSGWIQVLQQHAHASFMCSRCHHSWSSHQVVILFLISWDRRSQGWVWMKVYRQQCDRCSSEKYEEPQFTETDVSHIVRHLILDIREKCYGQRVDSSELSEVVWGHTGPHKPQHCEACKLGIHKQHHWSSKGTQHHRKAQSPGHSGNTEETKRRAAPSIDYMWLDSSCIVCFCLIVIVIVITIVYLK